jgi:hypothetical protein
MRSSSVFPPPPSGIPRDVQTQIVSYPFGKDIRGYVGVRKMFPLGALLLGRERINTPLIQRKKKI